jgi:ribosomal-protein-alanine N-acetyltransferase
MSLHPSRPSTAGLRLYGRRVVLRPLVPHDFAAWSEVRRRNGTWLTRWEPARPAIHPDPDGDRDLFAARCVARDRERHAGTQYSFGFFVDGAFAGEVNLNNVMRGALQTGTIGYWIDRERAGRSYTPEATAVLMRFAFEDLHLHRIEVCIIPRNAASRRVVDKLGLRDEGTALRYLEIDGVWEDHVRYGFTAEEWSDRRDEFSDRWLGD